MSEVNKRMFTVNIDGTDVKLSVCRPSNKIRQAGDRLHNKTFADAVNSGSLVKGAIEKVMRSQHLWDDDKQKEYESIHKEIFVGEKKLAQGGIRLSEGRKIALSMRENRMKLRELMAERNQLDLFTAEAQAENARFGYLVSMCTHHEDAENFGKTFYQDHEDYLNRADESATIEIASQMSRLLYNIDDDWAKKLAENAWLLKFGFCNDKLALIDREGNLVDSDYKKVNDKGQRINPDGKVIDDEGTPIKEDGTYDVVEQPFLDDDGNPVVVKEETSTP